MLGVAIETGEQLFGEFGAAMRRQLHRGEIEFFAAHIGDCSSFVAEFLADISGKNMRPILFEAMRCHDGALYFAANQGVVFMNVLVAGGAGYIGSHTVKRLKEAGHLAVIYDNGSRGHPVVAKILNVPCVVADLNDRATLTRTLRANKIDTVMHFAAFAYVGESVEKPLMYYQNNVATTISVLQAMKETAVKKFVFSSTCAVYGDPDRVPITEDEKKSPVSPYGRSKIDGRGGAEDYALRIKNSALRRCDILMPAAARWMDRSAKIMILRRI